MTTIVTTQAEYDAALAALNGEWGIIEIRSPKGVWIHVRDTGSASVRASGSASVQASGSASVRAWGSASVRAWGSASVRAWGSASVQAWDSASVRAWGSASVRAWGSASVQATPHVAVHLHSAAAVVEGGVLIDVTDADKTGPAWLEHHGIEVADSGLAIVYKAVDARWTTRRGFDYSPGNVLVAPDWTDRPECGGGLHFGPTPWMAKLYQPEATRYVACEVLASELVPIPGSPAKAKARACTVLYECDEDGNRITEAVAS